MSDNLQNHAPRDRGLFSLFFALGLSENAAPEHKEDFDYPSFMARELTRGLRAYGELALHDRN